MVVDRWQHYQGKPNDAVELTRKTLALVLASGEGASLGELTAWRAKASLHFGGNYRLVDFALSNCVNSGIRRIGVLTQYKSHSLIRHLQRAWGFMRAGSGEFIEILPAQQRTIQKRWYQGTADALFQNLDIIQRHHHDYVLVVNGGHVYTMNYAKMLRMHVRSGADATVGCIDMPVGQASSSGVLSVDGNMRITRFTKPPPVLDGVSAQLDRVLVPTGVYIFSRDFLYGLLYEDAAKSRSSHDFINDIIPSIIHCAKVLAFPFRSDDGEPIYWRDVGTVDAYWQTNVDLCSTIPPLNLYDYDWPIWTYQHHCPPTKILAGDNGRRGGAIDSLTSGGCVLSGALTERSLVFFSTMIGSHSEVKDSVVLPRVSIGKNCRITKAIIDKGAIVPDGMVIGEDLGLDRQRFRVTTDSVVLVTRGMLEAI
ncbi:MAG: glucose-1-phosphate adenylyltransferase [Thiothrix sp.]|uniref:glucose-1-phosphate adenylyltransferase n=1 Tax=Thiothrix sp. TaxID=1032 RepID=UPI002639C803|nr:glucose-1-phosphate adenylyltransferase [Thiothrix sp.]MDD5394980.1 glucose-1-phosphate adenylyltransferase [Thiothrix sp.]